MTRSALLASATMLAAATAFADTHGEAGSDAMTEDAGVTDPGVTDARETQRGSYASGTMDSGQLEDMIRTSNIVGGDVYAVEADDDWNDEEWNDMDVVESVDDGWTDIGDITDVVLSPDGEQAGLIVSHGGFLDIGDDTVLLTMDQVKRIGTTDAVDRDFNYVVRMTEEQIEEMPEVEENWY